MELRVKRVIPHLRHKVTLALLRVNFCTLNIKAVFIFHCCKINFHTLSSKLKHLYYFTMSRSPDTVHVAPLLRLSPGCNHFFGLI